MANGANDREQREHMVQEQLVARGIRSPAVLDAMRQVPRHEFVSPEHRAFAYEDRPLPIGEGQTISQPYMVALVTERLALPESGGNVLEVGTGSGYQAAVLSRVAKSVVTLERLAPLAERARDALSRLGYANVTVLAGDGTQGDPDHAPYDAIMVSAASPDAPAPLLEQLRDGARLAIPLGRGPRQILTLFEKRGGAGGGAFSRTEVCPCAFVPLVTETRRMCARALISGDVQGVGFRYFAQREATALGLAGWVRNNPDGTVEAEADGEESRVRSFLDRLREGPGGAHVTDVTVACLPPSRVTPSGFRITG